MAETLVIALGGNAITRPGEPGTIPQQFAHTGIGQHFRFVEQMKLTCALGACSKHAAAHQDDLFVEFPQAGFVSHF